MNAGGVPKTCKSYEKVRKDKYSGARVSNTWIMRPLAGDNQAKAWLIPNEPFESVDLTGKAVKREWSSPSPIS